MPGTGKCPHCRFFKGRQEGSTTGYCHRLPPTLLMDTDSARNRRLTSRYPYVGEEDFCGEFNKKKKDAE
jgi:hypothetical protein